MLATQASVASYKASVRFPEMVGTIAADGEDGRGPGSGVNLDDVDDDSDDGDGDSDDGEGGVEGISRGSGSPGPTPLSPTSLSGPGGSSVAVATKRRPEEVATRASVRASAARARLVLLKAWEAVASSTNSGVSRDEKTTTTEPENGSVRARDILSPPGLAVARRFLLQACRLAALRVGGQEGVASSKGEVSPSKTLPPANGAEGYLAGPMPKPPLDMPPRADVERALLVKDGDSLAQALLPSEKCLLCGAAMREEALAEQCRGNEPVAGHSTGSVWLRPEVSPNLPGWAVCQRGHRMQRCMNTLEPTLAASYRRCEVCRCLLEVGPAADVAPLSDTDTDWRAWASGGLRSERERCFCLFCDVLLLTV